MLKIVTNNKGVTLIEILLYIGLLSIFLLVLVDIFMGGINLGLDTEATSAVQQDGKFILTRMMYDVSRADSVSQPATLGSSSSSLVLTIGGIVYTYSLNGSNLTLSQGGETLNLNGLGSQITNLNFTRVGNVSGKPTFQVSISLKSTTERSGNQFETRDFQTTLGLR